MGTPASKRPNVVLGLLSKVKSPRKAMGVLGES